MEQTNQPQITIPSNPNPTIHTLQKEHEYYQQLKTMATRLGLSEWFTKSFGTESEWTSQFSKQSYDKQE